LGRFEPTFGRSFENQLEQYIFEIKSRLFGITNIELRHLLFELAKLIALKHMFHDVCAQVDGIIDDDELFT